MSQPLQTELSLPTYTKSSWLKSVLLGFLIGIAIIVPGISGATVAIIFRLYDEMLFAIGNIFKKFKRCFFFLLPIGIGGVLGLGGGFLSVRTLLDIVPFSVIMLFAGLMFGAIPALTDELKGVRLNVGKWLLLFVGIAIPVAVGILSVHFTAGANDPFETLGVGVFVLSLVYGIIAGVASVVPGLSVSAIFMAVGWFSALYGHLHVESLLASPLEILLYAFLAIGFLVGLLLSSKLLSTAFEKAHDFAYSMIVGLSLGSIFSMFYNPDIFEKVYNVWSELGSPNPLDLVLGLCLFIVGLVVSYLLVRYQRKKDAALRSDENGNNLSSQDDEVEEH